ncbi:hypothetical protein OE88DRAFT_28425 [Heliocybe sulcata]|uniref:Secreted protein n=1 Tax=Heliocybe sulcata TaxID=5364 RepID=A0A5C3NHZ5_9AGAM|nr:hypothetical protein OE88DRAFT_28425 [Heliocybe sulcata]
MKKDLHLWGLLLARGLCALEVPSVSGGGRGGFGGCLCLLLGFGRRVDEFDGRVDDSVYVSGDIPMGGLACGGVERPVCAFCLCGNGRFVFQGTFALWCILVSS